MTEQLPFLKRIFTKPPIALPIILVFHIIWWGYSIYSNAASQPFPSALWTESLWLLGYTVCWLFICDLKKQAANGYIAITILNLILRFTLTGNNREFYTDVIFPADLIFCFFLLLFYKRFS